MGPPCVPGLPTRICFIKVSVSILLRFLGHSYLFYEGLSSLTNLFCSRENDGSVRETWHGDLTGGALARIIARPLCPYICTQTPASLLLTLGGLVSCCLVAYGADICLRAFVAWRSKWARLASQVPSYTLYPIPYTQTAQHIYARNMRGSLVHFDLINLTDREAAGLQVLQGYLAHNINPTP